MRSWGSVMPWTVRTTEPQSGGVRTLSCTAFPQEFDHQAEAMSRNIPHPARLGATAATDPRTKPSCRLRNPIQCRRVWAVRMMSRSLATPVAVLRRLDTTCPSRRRPLARATHPAPLRMKTLASTRELDFELCCAELHISKQLHIIERSLPK